MAVIQISKIQVRRGLQENLPQLSSGEFGWSIDTRRLYIGNGTLVEGAPEIGVTEILTQYSSQSQAEDIDDLKNNVSILQSNVTTLNTIISNISAVNYTLADNTAAFTPVGITSGNLSVPHVADYTIVRGTISRSGTIRASVNGGNVLFEDNYTETANTGVILGYISNPSNVCVAYATTSIGIGANLTIYVRLPITS